jgi:hypothetical protein
MYPLGSLHDRMAKDWELIRSYALKGGHLFAPCSYCYSLPRGTHIFNEVTRGREQLFGIFLTGNFSKAADSQLVLVVTEVP